MSGNDVELLSWLIWPQNLHETQCVFWLFSPLFCVLEMKCVSAFFGIVLSGKLPQCMIHHLCSDCRVHSFLTTHRLLYTGEFSYSRFHWHTIEYTIYYVQSLTHHAYLFPSLMLVIIDNVIYVLCRYVLSNAAIGHFNLNSPYHISSIQSNMAFLIILYQSSYDSPLLYLCPLSC